MYPISTQHDPADLVPNPWNSNHVSPDNEAKLEASIRRHGFFKPVIVREVGTTLEILGGEHRALVAAKMGLTSIPILNLGTVGDAKAKEIGLLDNSRYGADDALSLASLLASLGDIADLATFLPYSDTELKDILIIDNTSLDDISIEEDEELSSESGDPELDLPKPPKTHTIMRFKVPIADAERITLRVADTQKRQGFTLADEMTNAGDALVHLLILENQSMLIDHTA